MSGRGVGLKVARINRGTGWLKVVAAVIVTGGVLLGGTACSGEFTINVNTTTITIKNETVQSPRIVEGVESGDKAG